MSATQLGTVSGHFVLDCVCLYTQTVVSLDEDPGVIQNS